MATSLTSVSDFVAAARVLLQDLIVPYRYDDDSLLMSLNTGLYEARKLRPDLFIALNTPATYALVDGTVVAIDTQYKTALLYYICGFAQLRDGDNTSDERAGAFIGKFTAELTGNK